MSEMDVTTLLRNTISKRAVIISQSAMSESDTITISSRCVYNNLIYRHVRKKNRNYLAFRHVRKGDHKNLTYLHVRNGLHNNLTKRRVRKRHNNLTHRWFLIYLHRCSNRRNNNKNNASLFLLFVHTSHCTER